MLEVKKYSGKSLSRFRTRNTADFYADITSADDAIEAFEFAQAHNLKPFVLGAGSNVFFKGWFNDFVSKAIVSLESYNIPIDLETVTACLFKSANIC